MTPPYPTLADPLVATAMESRVIIPPTLPTFGHATVYVYPTVAPRVVVVPIITCIIGFPVLVMLVICALRYRARRARITAKNAHSVESSASALELTSSSSILASRCTNGKAHRLKKRKKALVRFKPMPEIDLDTVVEEKSEFDAEVTASDLLTTPEELVIPEETTPPASFRAYRYMGAVTQPPASHSPNKASPYRSPHLDKVAEELELCDEMMLEVSDDEQLDDFDEDEEDDLDEDDIDLDLEAIEMEGVCLEVEDGDDQLEGSDDGALGTCFALSPKQVAKSPTGVHLALKKLDGAIKRRHSSPVKVNYGKNRGHQQRSSAKVNYTYAKEEENTLKPPPLKYDFDYIDRELMPRYSPRRSHSVKYTMSRRATSFTGKKRHGESFKLRSKSFSRSISQVHDGTDGRLRGQPRSASTSQEFHNGVMECDVHVVNEYGAEISSSSCSERCMSGATSTKSVSDADTFPNDSETEWSAGSRERHNPVRVTVSLPVRTNKKDSESPLKRVSQGSRTACSEEGACRVPTITSVDIAGERESQCQTDKVGLSLSDGTRQEEGGQCQQECAAGRDGDEEGSTLV